MLSLDQLVGSVPLIMIAYHPVLLLITTLTGLGIFPGAEGGSLIHQIPTPVTSQTLYQGQVPRTPVPGNLPSLRDRAPDQTTRDASGRLSPNPDSPIRATQEPLELAQNQPNPATRTERPPRNRFARKDILWLLLLGFGTLAFAGIFAGGFYLLTHSGEQVDDEEGEEIPETPEVFKDPPDKFSEIADQPELESPVLDKRDLAENAPVPPHHGNGYNERAIEPSQKLPPSAAIPPPPEEGLVRSEPPQLARIDAIETLIEDLQSRVPTQRRKAIWELGQKGDSRAMQPLVTLLMDSDSRQRSLILASLAEIGNRTMQPMNRALILSLQDSNPEVRKNAIRDLTRIYDLVSQTSQLLRHASEDSDPEVREAAQWALSQLNRLRPGTNSESRSSLQNWSPPTETYPEDIP
ncbi:HEAT repeat domain-containing protein [Phormidium pseudopriestleyi FRX01]|uniref:HEAT repeat domain-containing protein n=1 Tax=Phormidium pseudopriestleyi FRX01 TaxID=1759528 RepID=A0ABS3FZ73_9CYAN|nr:HEAT repeat domain-containing protein [Phormidium pseudopriestleyi]MBO0351926.1 HEAT repeat domain-containing protein [Phormidium pseudopriestleyi FRX01]